MSGTVKVIENDSQFQPEMANAGMKLVVADFFATWCGPCRNIAPVFQELAAKYPKAVFLKIDVDKCPETAQMNNVSAMPTFIFYRGGAKVDSQRGADPNALEQKIKKWYTDGEEGGDDGCPVKGHMDLTQFLQKAGCECLNESDDHPLDHALTQKGGYLESDCDEQLILALEFNQKIKLHSMRIEAPADKGPKTLKLFVNQTRTLDFDKAESMEPLQTIVLSPEDFEKGNIINLRFVKLQNVENINLFIKDNQSGGEVTQIDYIAFYGSPLSTTNMTDFKRVAGKKGESH